jgi:hypothetical protein
MTTKAEWYRAHSHVAQQWKSIDCWRVDANGNPLATSELFDRATGSFTSLGSMQTARFQQSATLLTNGKVLVAGGGTASTELFDPATGTFSSTGSMEASHSYQTATLLPNGKVLVAGGPNDSKYVLAFLPALPSEITENGLTYVYDLTLHCRHCGDFPIGTDQSVAFHPCPSCQQPFQAILLGEGDTLNPLPFWDRTGGRGIYRETLEGCCEPAEGQEGTTGHVTKPFTNPMAI